jgi:hypothetical protein
MSNDREPDMAENRVYFIPAARDESPDRIAAKAAKLIDAAFEGVVVPERPCAVKTHFGEGDNTGYVPPRVVRKAVDYAIAAGGRPFVTDTNTLYRGNRNDAVAHLKQARDHGFTDEALGAPVLIADGLMGTDQVSVPIDGGKHFEQIRIAAALHHADSSLVVTHVKGHCQTGFGGAIKNVGMGCAARAGKLAQHHEGEPVFDDGKCTACGTCVQWCPTGAIEMHGTAQLVAERCIGCGECYAICPSGAIGFTWGTPGPVLAEKICEHALGFVAAKRGRIGYLSDVTCLTKNCDCIGHAQQPDYPDIGLLAATDIVAVDKAAADLTRERFGEDIWSAWWPESQYEAQFAYGEELGLGRTDYDLVTLDEPT